MTDEQDGGACFFGGDFAVQDAQFGDLAHHGLPCVVGVVVPDTDEGEDTAGLVAIDGADGLAVDGDGCFSDAREYGFHGVPFGVGTN